MNCSNLEIINDLLLSKFWGYIPGKRVDVSTLVGKELELIKVNGANTHLVIKDWDGIIYVMYHDQDCCETVYLEDVCGDLNDLVGTPILAASKESNRTAPPLDKNDDSHLWTFYKFATIKGSVTLRWYGTSNGCYSEDVDFVRVDLDKYLN